MIDFLFSLGVTWLQMAIATYVAGAAWSFLDWTKQIHETVTTARLALAKRDKSLANSMNQSARDLYAAGIWTVLAWPLVVMRNIYTILEVRRDYNERKRITKTSE